MKEQILERYKIGSDENQFLKTLFNDNKKTLPF
jgi:hypothetical protein